MSVATPAALGAAALIGVALGIIVRRKTRIEVR
jgi:ABC-type proline/glycine betaine transport system permease subunit